VRRKMKLTVADIVITYREVEVAPTCPKCGVDLSVSGSVIAWEWSDQGRIGSLRVHPPPSPDLSGTPEEKKIVTDVEAQLDGKEPEGFEYDPEAPMKCGENFIEYAEYYYSCGHLLAG
jgi:hypothetical protein